MLTKSGLEDMFRSSCSLPDATHFSIFDEKDNMLNSHWSEDGADLKSGIMKRLRTGRHSKFSNNLQMESKDLSTGGRSSILAPGKKNSNRPRTISCDDIENIPSEICKEDNPLHSLLPHYIRNHTS